MALLTMAMLTMAVRVPWPYLLRLYLLWLYSLRLYLLWLCSLRLYLLWLCSLRLYLLWLYLLRLYLLCQAPEVRRVPLERLVLTIKVGSK